LVTFLKWISGFSSGSFQGAKTGRRASVMVHPKFKNKKPAQFVPRGFWNL
jgi:hypothetical protein